MRKLLFIFSIVSILNLNGQDNHFSQFFIAPQFINPSAFGVFNSFEAGVQYKGQWNSFTSGYKSYAAFVNKSFKPQPGDDRKSFAAMGLNVVYDKAGSNQLTHFKMELPFNVTTKLNNRGFLAGGIKVGFGQLALKSGNFTWGNQFDGFEYNPAFSSNEFNSAVTRFYFDCAAGISYSTFNKTRGFVESSEPKNLIGLSVNHINKPNYSVLSGQRDRLKMRFNFYEYHHLYASGTNLSFIPSVLAQYQGGAYEVVVGTYVRRMFFTDSKYTGIKKGKYVGLGVFYRLKDACSVNLMVELKNYTFAVNYDLNVSKLRNSSKGMGGLELSITVNDATKYLYKGYGKF
jgi:type IX secretion system PorP/SprF family membrane protein